MTSFDTQQIDLLRPLAESRTIVYFPLFANTFPLAFHYSQALRRIGVENPEAYIIYHPWDQGPPLRMDERIHLYYATKHQLDRYRVKHVSVHITLYRPTHFFMDRTATTAYQLNHHGHNGELFLNRDSGNAILSGARRIEIVSDTPEQADYLKHELQTTLIPPPIIEIAKRQDAIARVLRAEQQSDSRIYFFSAPGTARLLSEGRRFVPVRLNSGGFCRADFSQQVHDLFDTYCAIAGESLNQDNQSEISAAVTAYHSNLFEAADSAPEAFEEVFLRYNEMAWRLDSIAVFDNADGFARSISAHHVGRTSTAKIGSSGSPHSLTSSVADSPGIVRHRHVHFGAGNLGLGLVVPLMHSNAGVAILTNDSTPKWDVFNGDSAVHGVGVPAEIIVGHTKVQIVIVRPETPEGVINPFFNTIVDDWKTKGKHILVLTSFETQAGLIAPIIEQAESLSTALGEGQRAVAPIIARTTFSGNPPLLPFENQVCDVMKYINNVELVTTVVDRICSSVTIEKGGEGKPVRLNVDCGDYVSVIFGPSKSAFPSTLVPRGISSFYVRVVETEDHASFFKRRKYWLFNQLHFMVALFAYPYLKGHGYAFGEARNQALNLAVDGMLAEMDTEVFIRTITDLQILRLLVTTKREVLKDIFKKEDMYFCVLELRKYVSEVLDRIRRRPDEVGRVLSRDRLQKNRQKLRDHLNELKVFHIAHKEAMEDLGIKDCPQYTDFDYALQRLAELTQELALEVQPRN